MNQIESAALKKKRDKYSGTIAYHWMYQRFNHAYRLVMVGKFKKTAGGLTKKDLRYNKQGRVVSKARSVRGEKVFVQNGLNLWKDAYMEMRDKTRAVGFNKIAKGTQFYKDICQRWELKTLARINAARARRGLRPVSLPSPESQLKLEGETLKLKSNPHALTPPLVTGDATPPPRSHPTTPGQDLD